MGILLVLKDYDFFILVVFLPLCAKIGSRHYPSPVQKWFQPLSRNPRTPLPEVQKVARFPQQSTRQCVSKPFCQMFYSKLKNIFIATEVKYLDNCVILSLVNPACHQIRKIVRRGEIVEHLRQAGANLKVLKLI